jgi:hypothetical protein
MEGKSLMAKKSSSSSPFSSALLSEKEPVYGEHNAHLLVTEVPPDQSRGHCPRDWEKHPHGAGWNGSKPFPAEFVIPRDQWDERIKEQEAKKERLSDKILEAGLPCKDQNGTNYCWINAPTHVAEINCIQQNQRMPDGSLVLLSPASVGCKVKGFSNSGGWGQEGLDYAIEHGYVPVKYWPANAISRKYDTAEAWAAAQQYKPTNYFDLESENFDQKASCHLRRIATADGYDWWSHEVTGYDLVIVAAAIRDKARRSLDALWTAMNRKGFAGHRIEKDMYQMRVELAGSKYGTRQRNSWSMTYGEKGFFILTESKATPTDACCSVDMLPA